METRYVECPWDSDNQLMIDEYTEYLNDAIIPLKLDDKTKWRVVSDAWELPTGTIEELINAYEAIYDARTKFEREGSDIFDNVI